MSCFILRIKDLYKVFYSIVTYTAGYDAFQPSRDWGLIAIQNIRNTFYFFMLVPTILPPPPFAPRWERGARQLDCIIFDATSQPYQFVLKHDQISVN